MSQHPERRSILAGAAALIAGPAIAQTTPGLVRVNVETGAGLIVLELNAEKAPLTTANFLRYVDQKRYDKSSFYRASKPVGATSNDYGVVQGGLQNDPARVLRPVAHEPTTKTGLKHVDGTISLARNAPGTGTSDFFICVGEQAYLNANPDAPGDNQGFAAFGQVVEGMDVVKKILGSPTHPTRAPSPAMAGQMLDPPIPVVRMVRA